MSKQIFSIFGYIFGSLLLVQTASSAHNGNLDEVGGHNETSRGGYHCHRDVIILAPDGEFLGIVFSNCSKCSEYDSECITNEYSQYGSPYGTKSIFNNYSQYGSPYGSMSVCNSSIGYEDTPALYYANAQDVIFLDVIGPNSATLVGQALFSVACQ